MEAVGVIDYIFKFKVEFVRENTQNILYDKITCEHIQENKCIYKKSNTFTSTYIQIDILFATRKHTHAHTYLSALTRNRRLLTQLAI